MAKGGAAPSGASSSQFFIVTGSNVNLPPCTPWRDVWLAGSTPRKRSRVYPPKFPPKVAKRADRACRS
jgi:hypothetical protein